MRGIDISFSQPPASWWKAQFQAGYRVAVQDLWTGGYAGNDGLKAVAATNLRHAREAGFKIAAYANASPPDWWPLATQMAEIKANAGSEWANIDLVVVDVELAGITMARVMELADALEAAGKQADVLYTGSWFWTGHMGNSTDSRWKRFKLWPAQYDGVADLSVRLFGPWAATDVVGKQFAGTTELTGYAVDLNEFAEGFIREDGMATPEQVQAALDAHQRVLDAFQTTLNGMQAALDAHQKTLEAHQRAIDGRPAGGGVSEARAKELIRAAKHSI